LVRSERWRRHLLAAFAELILALIDLRLALDDSPLMEGPANLRLVELSRDPRLKL
jgi:hypothetical protein